MTEKQQMQIKMQITLTATTAQLWQLASGKNKQCASAAPLATLQN